MLTPLEPSKIKASSPRLPSWHGNGNRIRGSPGTLLRGNQRKGRFPDEIQIQPTQVNTSHENETRACRLAGLCCICTGHTSHLHPADKRASAESVCSPVWRRLYRPEGRHRSVPQSSGFRCRPEIKGAIQPALAGVKRLFVAVRHRRRPPPQGGGLLVERMRRLCSGLTLFVSSAVEI